MTPYQKINAATCQTDVDNVVDEYVFDGDYGRGTGRDNSGLSYEDMIGIADKNGWDDDADFLRHANEKWYSFAE